MKDINIIHVSVTGNNVGIGKSHVLLVIEKALRAEYGNDLMLCSRDLQLEKNLCGNNESSFEKLSKKNTVVVLTE